MSKQNKVNPGKYTQAGRLSQDDAARERMKQVEAGSTRREEGRPPAQLKATPSGQADVDADDDDDLDEQEPLSEQDETEDEER